jgi:hypothetical protein
MMKFAIACVAVAAFAAPALAGDGATYQNKDNSTNSQGNLVGVYSSLATGNGAAVGGNGTCPGCDSPYDNQTSSPGSRSDIVQQVLGMPGQPHSK